MFVTSTELKKNLGKFLKLIEKENIIILKRGKPVAKLLSIRAGKETPITDALCGALKGAKIDSDREKSERLKKYESAC
ncbi:phd_YefM [bacterium BMS3Abin07]|nr:phd_YefM [bacterium BMS3Abin07]HDZ01733.1 type II toxin-antitoxin system Phd/YefM family antitoxin [Nitrospirota bacterium]